MTRGIAAGLAATVAAPTPLRGTAATAGHAGPLVDSGKARALAASSVGDSTLWSGAPSATGSEMPHAARGIGARQ